MIPLKPIIAALLSIASAAAAQAAPASSPPAAPYTTLSVSGALDFRYSFPTVVGSYPLLLAKIRADEAASRADSLDLAQSDTAERHDQDYPFHQHQFWRDWTVAGDGGRLLSLQSHTDNFTGGAHGNHFSSALLWDGERDAEVDVDQLFGGPAKLWKQVGPSYCRKLDAERRQRKTDSVGCPQRKELTIVPVDTDFDYEFDSLRVIADPYVAGSYAEGTYVIALPITPVLLKTIARPYRSSFEAQRQ